MHMHTEHEVAFELNFFVPAHYLGRKMSKGLWVGSAKKQRGSTVKTITVDSIICKFAIVLTNSD